MEQADTILKLKAGDHSVFTTIVDGYQKMVYNTALSIVQHEQDAEDVTQDVFVKVYESIGDFNSNAKLSTWLYRITISKALDTLKSKNRLKRGGFLKRIFTVDSIDEPVTFEHPGVQLDNKENAKVLFAALNNIPEKQRLVFILQKMEGLSQEEIAAVMNIGIEAIESLQARAKKNLKTLLQSYYEQHFK